MDSYIIQFLWVQPQKDRTVTCLSHCVVAVLTAYEVTVVKDVSAWLTERKREVLTNIEATKATGGDVQGVQAVLEVVADQYGYPEYTEDNPILAERGINRTALVP